MKYIFPGKNSYLDFQWNLLQASVKNFQIVHESDTDYIIMQVSMLQMMMIEIIKIKDPDPFYLFYVDGLHHDD